MVNTKGNVIAMMTGVGRILTLHRSISRFRLITLRKLSDSILSIGEVHRPWFGSDFWK